MLNARTFNVGNFGLMFLVILTLDHLYIYVHI